MAARRAFRPTQTAQSYRSSMLPTPLATDTESGFARLFVPTLLAVLVATGCLGWESWRSADVRPADAIASMR
jgi:hypothetical protein